MLRFLPPGEDTTVELGSESIGFLANLASTEESRVITGVPIPTVSYRNSAELPQGSHVIWNSITLELFRDGLRDF